jgi:hypothetical protein
MAENLAEALRENKNDEEGIGAVFTTRPNKLGWKGLQLTNTPAMYKL